MKKLSFMAAIGLFLAGQAPVTQADTITTNFGMTFHVVNTWYLPTFNTTNEQSAFRFTAAENIETDRFAFLVAALAGSPSMHISIQSDDGGNPSGTILAETTFTPTGTGAYYGLFDSSAALTAGQVYHVVRYVTNASATDWLQLVQHGGTGANFENNIKTGQPDPQQTSMRSTTGGATWTANPQVNSSIHAISLGSADGSAVGVPYTQGHASPNIGGTTVRGQRFIYDGLSGDQVTDIELLLRTSATGGADDLRVYLMTDTGTVLSSNVFLQAGFTNDVFTWYNLELAEPVVLTAGEAYRLGLESSGSAAASYVASTRGSGLTNMWDATFQGTNSFLISGTTGIANMGREGTSTLWYDMNFNLGIEVIPEPTTVLLGALGLLLLYRRRQRR